MIELKINNQRLTIIPLYIRANDWVNTLTNLEKLLTEKDIQNPVIIGDMNVRIGNIEQVLDEHTAIYFKSGTASRKSRDLIINTKGRDFVKLCNDFGVRWHMIY